MVGIGGFDTPGVFVGSTAWHSDPSMARGGRTTSTLSCIAYKSY